MYPVQLGLMQHVPSSHCAAPCECVRVGIVHVCSLLGRCFPVLVTLHHSDREEQLVRGGGGRTLWRCECDEVLSLQRESRGPGASLAGRGGALLSKSSPFHPLSFGEVKRDVCFFKVRVMIHTNFLDLRRNSIVKKKLSGPILYSTFFFFFFNQVCHFKASFTVVTMLSSTRGKRRGLGAFAETIM